MLKILDRYLAKKFLMNLLVGMAGATVIFFSYDFFQIIEKVTSGRLYILDVPYLSLKSIPSIISYEMMHFAGLISGLLTMSDLSSHLEVVAIKTSGISFGRMVKTPLIISFLVSCSMFLFTEFVSVDTFRSKTETFRKLDGYIISRNRNNIYYKSDNRFYSIYNVNGYSNKIKNCQIVELEGEDVKKIINARSGEYNPETGEWLLKDVVVNLFDKNEIIDYDTYDPEIKESPDDFLKYRIIADESFYSTDPYDVGKELSFKQIRDNISFLQKSGGNYRRLLTHVYHQRVAYPFSFFIMVVIGFALLSRFSRAGKGKIITVGILIGFSYYVISAIAKAMGFGNVVPMLLSAWIPNIVFGVIALYLFLKADE